MEQAKQISKQTLFYCEGGQTIKWVPRDVVKPSSLDIFKTHLNIALVSLPLEDPDLNSGSD